MIFRKRQNKK